MSSFLYFLILTMQSHLQSLSSMQLTLRTDSSLHSTPFLSDTSMPLCTLLSLLRYSFLLSQLFKFYSDLGSDSTTTPSMRLFQTILKQMCLSVQTSYTNVIPTMQLGMWMFTNVIQMGHGCTYWPILILSWPNSILFYLILYLWDIYVSRSTQLLSI